jgi:cytidylate kinase
MAIITISRGTMSGGEALAGSLSEKLGWPAVGREVIKEAADTFGLSEKRLAEQLEKMPGFFHKFTSERRLYMIALQSAMIERALKDNFIYHGLAGHLLLKGMPQVLKVRLIAPMEYRIRQLCEKKQMNREDALKYIRQVDKQRAEWTRWLYNVDWSDPALYDVVFNLISLPLDHIAELICQTVKTPIFQDSQEHREALEQFHLANQVKMRLTRNDRTHGFNLEVTAKDSKVRVTGEILTGGLFGSGMKPTENEILKTAMEVPGVKGVEVDVKESIVTGE